MLSHKVSGSAPKLAPERPKGTVGHSGSNRERPANANSQMGLAKTKMPTREVGIFDPWLSARGMYMGESASTESQPVKTFVIGS